MRQLSSRTARLRVCLLTEAVAGVLEARPGALAAPLADVHTWQRKNMGEQKKEGKKKKSTANVSDPPSTGSGDGPPLSRQGTVSAHSRVVVPLLLFCSSCQLTVRRCAEVGAGVVSRLELCVDVCVESLIDGRVHDARVRVRQVHLGCSSEQSRWHGNTEDDEQGVHGESNGGETAAGGSGITAHGRAERSTGADGRVALCC